MKTVSTRIVQKFIKLVEDSSLSDEMIRAKSGNCDICSTTDVNTRI